MNLISMLWKGIPGDEQVYSNFFDGSGWVNPQVIPEIVTGTHPFWTPYYDQISFTAWKRIGTDHLVEAAMYNGPASWTLLGVVPGVTAHTSPAAAVLPGASGTMVLAWVAEPDGSIHFLTYDSLHWSASQTVSGAATSHSPVLAPFQNQVHMVWKGAHNHFLYHSSYNGAAWSAAVQLPFASTTSTPALTQYGNQLVMAWKGPEGDSGLYWSVFSGGSWQPAQRIQTFQTGTGPALIVCDDRLHLFWKGVGDDYSVFTTNFDGAFWWDQHQVPHVFTSSTPSLTLYDPAF
jgi:hypothetical protein